MKTVRHWTKEEYDLVRNLYQQMPAKELAEIMGRTVSAIQKKTAKLGVRKMVCYTPRRRGLPIGSTRVDNNGYTFVKLESGWKLLQRLKWEEYYGAPPEGTVSFKDGNRANVEKSNLYLTSPKEQLERNTANNLPQELKELVHTKGRLTLMINNRSKRNE